MERIDAELIGLAPAYGLSVLYSPLFNGWFVFNENTAELRGRIPDSVTLREAAARLAEIAGEMGTLYALRDEAKVASPGGKA